MELFHTSKHIHQVSTLNHVIVHCIYFATLFVFCRVKVEPEQEAATFVEDPEPEPRQQGKQTPIHHVDKIPLPSHVSLMHCIGCLPCYVSTAKMNPFLCMTYHLSQ